jgi:hypothetical protein
MEFDGFKSGGLHVKHAATTWNTRTISELNYGDCRKILYIVSNLKPEVHISNIQKLSSYFTEDILLFHYEDQLFNAAQKNNPSVCYESYRT